MTKYCRTLEAVIGRSAHEIQIRIQLYRYTALQCILSSIDDNEVLQLQIHLTADKGRQTNAIDRDKARLDTRANAYT